MALLSSRKSTLSPFYWKARRGWYLKFRGSNVRLSIDCNPQLDAKGKPVAPAAVRELAATYNRCRDFRNGIPDSTGGIPDSLADVAGLQEFDRAGTCVYFLVSEGRVVYVGQTVAIWRRLWQHLNGHSTDAPKTFDRVFYVRCKPSEMDGIERNYIRKFDPIYNRQCG